MIGTLKLIKQAEAAGLSLSVEGGCLNITAPEPPAEALLHELREDEQTVVKALSAMAGRGTKAAGNQAHSTPLVIQGDAARLPLPDQCVDMVFASPPYMDARTYGEKGIARDGVEWVDWMLAVTREALRVSRGVVMWVVSGVQRKGCYQPAVEGLAWEAHRAGIRLLWPNYWQKNSLPRGSAWFRPDVEYVLAFCQQGVKPHFDYSEIGSPPKYPRGGRFRNRRKDGSRDDGAYPTVKLAVPGNVCYLPVGGGHMGSVLAHENEAPFPESLADRFVKACCPPGDVVLDPFCGSGTTLAAAMKAGRRAIGVDIRSDQCELTKRRLHEVSCQHGHVLAK